MPRDGIARIVGDAPARVARARARVAGRGRTVPGGFVDARDAGAGHRAASSTIRWRGRCPTRTCASCSIRSGSRSTARSRRCRRSRNSSTATARPRPRCGKRGGRRCRRNPCALQADRQGRQHAAETPSRHPRQQTCHRRREGAAAGHRQSGLRSRAAGAQGGAQPFRRTAFDVSRHPRTRAALIRAFPRIDLEPFAAGMLRYGAGPFRVPDVPLLAGDPAAAKAGVPAAGAAHRFGLAAMVWRPCITCSTATGAEPPSTAIAGPVSNTSTSDARTSTSIAWSRKATVQRLQALAISRRHGAVRADRPGGRRVQPDGGLSTQLVAFRQHRQCARPARRPADRATVDQYLHRRGALKRVSVRLGDRA